MKRWLLHILLVSVLGMLAASCSQEADDPTLATEGGRVQLKFTIVLDDSPASRTWGSTYDSETATKAENAVNNMQILLFKADGSEYCGTLENVQYFSVDPQDKVYEFQGSIPLDADNNLVTTNGIDKLNCKIMVLANCSVDLTDLTDINDVLNELNDQVFSASSIYDATNGLKAGIPMWGIYTVTDLPVDRNYATNLDDDIYLLRSMAKIEVTLSDETWNNGDGYKIIGATLNQYNKYGFVVPVFKVSETTNGITNLVEKGLAEFSTTTDLSLEGVRREKQELMYLDGETTPSTLGFTATTPNRTFVVYVSEYAADLQGALIISLDFGSNDVKTFTHGQYTGGKYNNKPWNVIRNHSYKYTVSINGADLKAIIEIKSWNIKEHTYGEVDLK